MVASQEVGGDVAAVQELLVDGQVVDMLVVAGMAVDKRQEQEERRVVLVQIDLDKDWFVVLLMVQRGYQNWKFHYQLHFAERSKIS